MKRLVPLVPLLLLAACATEGPPPPHHLPAPHEAQDGFAWSTGEGGNSLLGSVIYRVEGVGQFTCAGGSVALTPEAGPSIRRTERLYGSTDHAVATVDAVRQRSSGLEEPTYASYVRSTKCGPDGRFAFHDLPDGGWFVIARAKPIQGHAGDVVIMRRVELRGGVERTLALR